MNNQFAGAQLVLKNGDPLEELRFSGRHEAALSASTGEFNASSKKDLVNNITKLMNAVNSGEVVPRNMSALANSQEYQNGLRQRREVLAAAFADPQEWAALGANMVLKMQEQRNREGFMRRISLGQTLKQGEVPRVQVPMWNAQAMIITSGAASIGHQLVRNKSFQPAEFEISANLRIEQIELEQNSGDLLEDAYNQGLDAIMVKEDLCWKRAADATVGVVNPLNYIVGDLTTKLLGKVRSGVTDWNLPATTAIISNDYWNDVIGSADFAQFLDPVTKYDLALHGYLGTLVGLELITDAFRQQNQKVLERGELYVVAAPENHAAFSDRGGVRSTPTSGADSGNSGKGWFINELISFTLVNARSVSKAVRI